MGGRGLGGVWVYVNVLLVTSKQYHYLRHREGGATMLKGHGENTVMKE